MSGVVGGGYSSNVAFFFALDSMSLVAWSKPFDETLTCVTLRKIACSSQKKKRFSTPHHSCKRGKSHAPTAETLRLPVRRRRRGPGSPTRTQRA